jgi:PAS domain S-box-containing protein
VLEKTFKNISRASGLLVFCLGLFYTLKWIFVPPINPIGMGVSFFGSIAFLLIGSGIVILSYPFSFFWNRLIGVILILMCLIRMAQWFFLKSPVLDQFFFFMRTNPLNSVSYALIGTLFLFWKKEQLSQIKFLYFFFAIFSSSSMSVLGLLAYFLGFGLEFEMPSLFGMIGVFIGDIGILSCLIYYRITQEINRYKLIPWVLGLIFCLFAVLLAGGIYLNQHVPKERSLTNLLVIYAILGGLIFSALASYLTYFWLKSLSQLKKAQFAEKEIETIKEETLQTLASAEVGLWKWDLKKDRVEVDATISRFFQIGESNREGPGQMILEKIHPEDRTVFIDALNWVFLNRKSSECTVRVIWSDRSVHYFQIKGDILVNSFPHISGIVWDVTKSHYTAQLLKLSDGITKVLSNARSLQEGAAAILELFHTFFDWQILTVWKRDSVETPYECVIVESVPGFVSPRFIELSRNLPRDQQDLFLQTISRTLQPVSVEDIGREGKYRRSEVAAKEGIKGGLVFPIKEKEFISGFIELFKKEPYTIKRDPSLNQLLNGIGITIGEFLRRKNAEIAEQELLKIVTASSVPIYTCNLEGTILTWNKASERVFGWRAEEIIGEKIEMLMPPERLNEFVTLKRHFREGIDLKHLRTERKTKEGKLLWLEITYSVLLDEEGRQSKISIMAVDITEEMNAQAALIKAEEKYRSFVENIDEWIWEVDAKGTFTYSNQAVTKILGYSKEEINGQSVYLYLNEQSKDSFKTEFDSSVKQKKGWKNRLFLWKDKRGGERISESVSFPMLDLHNELIGFRGAERDVTELKKIEKTKNEFISIVSHEIRSPLTSIHGALGLLTTQTDLSEKAKDLIQLAYRNSKLLADLVKDIIDIEKIELGKFGFQLQKNLLSPCIREAIQTARLISEKTGIQIVEENLLPNLEVEIDPGRLGQALGNLLSNAINFSPMGGHIFVSMELIGEKVRVYIRDEGPGIPAEFASRIFGKFEQAANVFGREKGTGLGLNIAKTIVEQMGGEIGYLSKPGQGAIFYIELPIAKAVT